MRRRAAKRLGLTTLLVWAVGAAAPAQETRPVASREAIPGPVDVRVATGARIPAVDISAKGTLLAFYERRWSDGDGSPHDIHLKRSTDGGKTWGDPIAITSDGKDKKKNYVNVAPIVDRDTGTIWVFYNWRDYGGTEGIVPYSKSSKDDGLTWSDETQVKNNDGSDTVLVAASTSRGIQLSTGRLLAPFSDQSEGMRPVGLYSDDHGKTWKFGKKIEGNGKYGWVCGECALVELSDGAVHVNMRYSGRAQFRNVALSRDGGVTWEKPTPNKDLPNTSWPPGTHSSVARLSDEKRHDKNRLVYSGHLPGADGKVLRENLAILLSYDEGKSWQKTKVVKEGPAGYSNLIVLPDMSIGCIYETFSKAAWNELRFSRFTLEWLTDGKDKVVPKEKPAGATGAGDGRIEGKEPRR